MKRLTPKQLQFAQSYLETGNKIEAYLCAYDCSGMINKTISRKAQHVASIPHVAAKISELQEAAAERSRLTVDDLIAEYRRIAFSTIADFVNVVDGVVTVRDLDSISPEQRACLRRFRVRAGHVEVELHDKVNARNALGKHLGLFEKKQREPEKVMLVLNMGKPPDED